MTEEATGWEAAYRKRPMRDRTPHREAEALAGLFRKHHVKRVLDLGCGDGRHLVGFVAQGFEMAGLDSAPTALKLAEGFLAKEGLSAELVCADMTALPYDDASFDAVISVKVINHQDIDGIRKTIGEIHRVLRRGGWLFVVVASYAPGEPEGSEELVRLGPKLYAKKEGHEAGVPHYFATQEEWAAEFSAFEIADAHKDGQKKTVILARKP